MPHALEPRPLDRRVLALLAEEGFGPELFNERQHEACERIDLYALRLVLRLVGELGIAAALATPRSVDELMAERGFAPAFRAPLGWLLDWLAQLGYLARDEAADGPRFRLARELPEPGVDEARAAGLAVDPSYAPAYAMLDEAAVAYGKVARGEASGERALFQNVALWTGYFSNANGYYAINNRVAAVAAAARLPERGGRVLEVGSGLGSATEALLERLGERGAALERYRATEPVAFFRRRAERALRARYAAVPLELGELDLNQPWAGQGVAPGSFDLVWGVNVFHLARRLDDVLREAREALAPGGWLVIGEGVRPGPHVAVAGELPFQLLPAFVEVELDPALRPRAGFLTAEQWLRALGAAGFREVTVVPDVPRLVALQAAFHGAAICGRR